MTDFFYQVYSRMPSGGLLPGGFGFGMRRDEEGFALHDSDAGVAQFDRGQIGGVREERLLVDFGRGDTQVSLAPGEPGQCHGDPRPGPTAAGAFDPGRLRAKPDGGMGAG